MRALFWAWLKATGVIAVVSILALIEQAIRGGDAVYHAYNFLAVVMFLCLWYIEEHRENKGD